MISQSPNKPTPTGRKSRPSSSPVMPNVKSRGFPVITSWPTSDRSNPNTIEMSARTSDRPVNALTRLNAMTIREKYSAGPSIRR